MMLKIVIRRIVSYLKFYQRFTIDLINSNNENLTYCKKIKKMFFEYSQEICNDYEKLLEAEKGHDVIIYVGENENLKEIRAHSFILSIRSQYFYAAFNKDWVEKKDGNFIFKKPNISPELFKIILR